MNNNFIPLSSLAMDLKRVAVALHNGSMETAICFTKEALRRKHETNIDTLPDYMKHIFIHLNTVLSTEDVVKRSEDVLMYSTLIQNYAVTMQNTHI